MEERNEWQRQVDASVEAEESEDEQVETAAEVPEVEGQGENHVSETRDMQATIVKQLLGEQEDATWTNIATLIVWLRLQI